MSRQDVLNDMRATLGIVPGWWEGLPDDALEMEWKTAKGFIMADTALPVKTKALAGLAAASAMRCAY